MSDEQPMAATIRSEPSREIVKLTELPERPNGWTKHLAVHYNYGSGSYILNSLESAESTRQAGFAQVWFLVCVFVSLCLSALNFSEAAVLHDENSQHSRSPFYSFLIFVQDEAAQIEVYIGGPVAAFSGMCESHLLGFASRIIKTPGEVLSRLKSRSQIAVEANRLRAPIYQFSELNIIEPATDSGWSIASIYDRTGDPHQRIGRIFRESHLPDQYSGSAANQQSAFHNAFLLHINDYLTYTDPNKTSCKQSQDGVCGRGVLPPMLLLAIAFFVCGLGAFVQFVGYGYLGRSKRTVGAFILTAGILIGFCGPFGLLWLWP